MTAYVLLRDQNEYGYVDTSIAGVFREAGAAKGDGGPASVCRRDRRGGDDSPDGEWQVSWRVEERDVD